MYNIWSYDQMTEYMRFIGDVVVDYGAGKTEPSTSGVIEST